MSGGVGKDVVDFNAIAEIGNTRAARDVIADFNAGSASTVVDRIDLHDLDARSGPGNQDFLFIGNDTFDMGVKGSFGCFIRAAIPSLPATPMATPPQISRSRSQGSSPWRNSPPPISSCERRSFCLKFCHSPARGRRDREPVRRKRNRTDHAADVVSPGSRCARPRMTKVF